MARVLMLGTSLRTKGGISTVVLEYIKAGLFERHDVRYIPTHIDSGNYEKIKMFFMALPAFLLSLLFGNYQVVHIHVSSRVSFLRKSFFIILTKICNKSLVLHVHGSEFDKFYDQEIGRVSKKYVHAIMNMADNLIVLSESWRNWFEGIIEERDKISVIQNCICGEDDSGLLNRDSKRLLFLGRVGDRKGIFDLIEALKMLKLGKNIPFHLDVGGDGDNERLAALVHQYELDECITIHGWIEPSERLELLKKSSLFILPSYNEGMPMSIIEAMSFGLPVISTYVGGIPEQIEDGVHGFLIQPGSIFDLSEKICFLLANDAVRSSMSIAVKSKFFEKFCCKTVLMNLDLIYEQALK